MFFAFVQVPQIGYCVGDLKATLVLILPLSQVNHVHVHIASCPETTADTLN